MTFKQELIELSSKSLTMMHMNAMRPDMQASFNNKRASMSSADAAVAAAAAMATEAAFACAATG